MYFFVTNRIDTLTSAIELAEINRLNLFEKLNQNTKSHKYDAKIIELDEVFEHSDVFKKLKLKGKAFNLFDYYQNIEVNCKQNKEQLMASIFGTNQYFFSKKENNFLLYTTVEQQIIIGLYQNNVYYVDYKDKWGFLDRRDFYKNGQLSQSIIYDDQGRMMCKQYYNAARVPVISMYYRGSSKTKTVLALIHLLYKGKSYVFNSLTEFKANFLMSVAKEYDPAAFIYDRSIPALSCLEFMQVKAKNYFVIHSRVANKNNQLMPVYECLPKLIESQKLNGLIVSTQGVKNKLFEIAKIPKEKMSIIPVSSIKDIKPINYSKRCPGKILLVSRVSEEKNVNDAIMAVIKVHAKKSKIRLDIWGYGDSYNNNFALNSAKAVIKNNKAESYIKLKGYKKDLSSEYDTAALQLLTSKYEGFSMALQEGQAHGLPGISYDVDFGPSEIIVDQETGFLIKPGNVDVLAEKILNLVNDDEQANYFSINSYKYAERFSERKVAKKWLEFLAD